MRFLIEKKKEWFSVCNNDVLLFLQAKLIPVNPNPLSSLILYDLWEKYMKSS